MSAVISVAALIVYRQMEEFDESDRVLVTVILLVLAALAGRFL